MQKLSIDQTDGLREELDFLGGGPGELSIVNWSAGIAIPSSNIFVTSRPIVGWASRNFSCSISGLLVHRHCLTSGTCKIDLQMQTSNGAKTILKLPTTLLLWVNAVLPVVAGQAGTYYFHQQETTLAWDSASSIMVYPYIDSPVVTELRNSLNEIRSVLGLS